MDPFIGEVLMFVGNFAPRGWAFCDGQLLPISQNTALFSIIGTTYGGDGRTTFALPDLRGRVPIHPGNGPGLSDRRLGGKGGSETTQITVANMPAHNHTAPAVNASSDGADTPSASGAFLPSNGRGGAALYASAQGTAQPLGGTGGTTGSNGGSQPFNNMQPFLGVNYIIALQGVFPSRS